VNETIVTLVGNVASDVRHGVTKDELSMASFRVASSTRRYDRAKGGWMDADTIFATVTCWRSLAEHVAASVRRGDPVLVTGRLKLRSYNGDNGGSRTSIEVDASAVGHNLTWGTSMFRKTTSARAESTSDRDAMAELVAQVEREPASASVPATSGGSDVEASVDGVVPPRLASGGEAGSERSNEARSAGQRSAA
jgi:single-strand DNA-binding protein